MDIIDVLQRMSRNDTGAFRELMQAYGPKVYLALLDRSGDRELALAATKRAFIDLYAELNAQPGCDPAERLLTLRALAEQDRALESERRAIAEDILRGRETKLPARRSAPLAAAPAPERRETPIAPENEEKADPPEPEGRKKRGGAGRIVAAAVLSLGIAAALWTIAGLLMSMNFIPEVPLGYAWFNANVAQWF